MKRLILPVLILVLVCTSIIFASNGFEELEPFDGTEQITAMENPGVLAYLIDNNIIVIVVMSIAGGISFFLKKQRVRYILLLVSLVYLGFYTGGCNCSAGAPVKFFYDIFHRWEMALVTLDLVLIPVVISLVFGRVFCGSVCPIGTLQEFIARRGKLLMIRHSTEKKLRLVKIALFIVLAGLTILRGEYILGKFGPFKALFGIQGTVIQLVLAGSILLLSLFVYRPFCRYVCPMGMILELTGRYSLFRLQKASDNCNDCSRCRRECPAGAIRDDNTIDNALCLRCGICVDICSKQKKSTDCNTQS